jgi:hypothetical protein
LGACSSDNSIKDDGSRDGFNAKTGENILDGVIGIERGSEYVITADANALTAALEDILESQGQPVTIKALEIRKLIASNNTNSEGLMLIGSTGNLGDRSTSIGIMLTKRPGGLYISDSPNGGPRTSTSCTGCAEGCNLMYYDINGRKVPYCQENGCPTYNCKKSETTI